MLKETNSFLLLAGEVPRQHVQEHQARDIARSKEGLGGRPSNYPLGFPEW